MKKSSQQLVYLFIALAALIVLAVVFFWPAGDDGDAAPPPQPMETPVQMTGEQEAAPEPEPAMNETPEPEPIQVSEPEPEPAEAEETPFDPEDQPRTYAEFDFAMMPELPDEYVLEDVELTRDGIQLKPLEPGEEPKPRFGTIKSPPMRMEFPSNAVSPMWKQEAGEGESVFIEVAVSPDGENFSLWHPIYQDDDAGMPAEFYPDGRPNPHYGYVPGGVLSWGYKQHQYFRYRATLYSEVEGSPTLEGVHVYYQDSTLGQGELAEVNEDQAE